MKKDSNGKKTDPILGFFVSGNFNHVLDPRPLAGPVQTSQHRDSLSSCKLGPLRPTGFGFGAFTILTFFPNRLKN